MARTRCYRNGVLDDENFPLDLVSEHLELDGAVVWVDLCAPNSADLQLVAEELGLHHLAVEDASKGRQRPKLDHYDSHDYFNAYTVRLDRETGELSTNEIGAFITPHALITVRRDESIDIEAVVKRWDGAPDLLEHGVAALMYGLLDYIVDSHFDAAETLDDEIEGLEDLLFDNRPRGEDVQRRSFELRKSLVLLRRVIMPMREVVNTILRRDLHVMTPAMTPYFQDVYDHVLRATEWTEGLRDLVTTILETNLTIQSNRLNVITKKVTGWAAIIAVPTAITGFYGQNVPYPGFGKTSGFLTSLLITLVASGLLYAGFKKRDWL